MANDTDRGKRWWLRLSLSAAIVLTVLAASCGTGVSEGDLDLPPVFVPLAMLVRRAPA